jgi:hypothetical protein
MRRWCATAALCGAILLVAPAAAGPTAADFIVLVTAGPTRQARAIPNNGTANVGSLSFRAGAIIDNDGGEEATARLRFVLADDLRFGSDAPDPTESCTTDGRTAECQTPLLIGTEPASRTSGWDWDVIAAQPGSYVLRAELTQTSVLDPNVANNSASATVVVNLAAPPTAAVSASSVRLTPAKPRAGTVVTATVRVSVGGEAVRPSAVACSGAIGSVQQRGAPRAGMGTARCSYRPPRSAKGKTLRGSVSVTASGKRLTRRFSTRLG